MIVRPEIQPKVSGMMLRLKLARGGNLSQIELNTLVIRNIADQLRISASNEKGRVLLGKTSIVEGFKVPDENIKSTVKILIEQGEGYLKGTTESAQKFGSMLINKASKIKF